MKKPDILPHPSPAGGAGHCEENTLSIMFAIMLKSDNLGYQLNWADLMLMTTYTSAIDDGMFSSTHFRSSSCENDKITGIDQTQENQPDPHKFCLRLAQPMNWIYETMPELNEHNRIYNVTNSMFISTSLTLGLSPQLLL